jgi:hypothetical protein
MDKTLACVAIGGTIAIRTIYFMYKYFLEFYFLRNDKNIISSISVTDIVFDDYFGK